jgi:hypothetical protein
MVLDRAARPVIVGKLVRGDLQLRGDKLHRDRRDVASPPRKPALDLEVLQQQAKPELRGAMLGPDQLQVRRT